MREHNFVAKMAVKLSCHRKGAAFRAWRATHERSTLAAASAGLEKALQVEVERARSGLVAAAAERRGTEEEGEPPAAAIESVSDGGAAGGRRRRGSDAWSSAASSGDDDTDEG